MKITSLLQYITVPRRFQSESPPRIGQKEHQHREDFQTAGEHIEDHDELGGVGVAAKVHHGADLIQAGADVVQGSGNGREVRHHVEAVQTDEQERRRKDEDVRCHIDVRCTDGLVVEQSYGYRSLFWDQGIT